MKAEAPQHEEQSENKPKKPLKRRVRNILIQLTIVVVALELLSVLIYPLITDQSYSRSRIKQALAVKRYAGTDMNIDTLNREPEYLADHQLHPYTGFSGNPKKDANVNEFGYWGPSPLLKREPNTVNVVLLGGSVSLQLYQNSKDILITELQKHPRFSGKEIKFVCMAVDGYKQPQQLMALSFMVYLGAEFDIVINLDGFNEIVLPFSDNLSINIYPYYPRLWNFYLKKGASIENTFQVARVMNLKKDQEELSRTFSNSLLKVSNFSLILWERLNNKYETQITEEYLKLVEMSKGQNTQEVSFGPMPNYANNWNQYFIDNTDRWKQASLQIQNLSELGTFSYFHFLQPNQYVEGSKVFSEEEKKIADVDAYNNSEISSNSSMRVYKWAAQKGYPNLINMGKQLQNEGVEFIDLTMMFSNTTEIVYSDACCHFNKPGYDMMATQIAKEIVEQ